MCTGRGGVLSHFCILSFHVVELTMNPGLPRKFPVYSYFYRSIDSMPPYSKNGNDNPVCKIAKETLSTKVRLVKTMVFPLVMYGCKSWTIKKIES